MNLQIVLRVKSIVNQGYPILYIRGVGGMVCIGHT